MLSNTSFAQQPVDLDAKVEILRQRAEILAREPVGDRHEYHTQQFIEFRLAGEHYAVETIFVSEVHPLRELTPLPGTPSFLLGIINLRSSILPVIDIRKFFGLPDVGLSDLNKIIVVHSLESQNPMHLGILVDAILGVRAIEEDDIQTTLVCAEGTHAGYIRGIFQGEKNERLILLDLNAILNDEHIVINQT